MSLTAAYIRPHHRARTLALSMQWHSLSAAIAFATFMAVTMGTDASIAVLESTGALHKPKAKPLVRSAINVETTDKLKPSKSSPTPIKSGERQNTDSPVAYQANKKVALHWSLDHEADMIQMGRHWEDKLLTLLDLCKFCFHEVFITIDPVHGGKDIGPKWLPVPSGELDTGAKEMLNSKQGKLLLEHVNAVVDRIKVWFRDHCRGHKVDFSRTIQVIDYSNPDNINRLNRVFNFSGDANIPHSPWVLDRQRKLFRRDHPYAWMWKNTFSYFHAIDKARSDYLLHFDSDGQQLKMNKITDLDAGQRPAYVGSALRMLERSPEVVMVVAPGCRRFFSSNNEWAVPFCNRGCLSLGDDLTVVQQQDPKADKRVLPFVSIEHYIVDVKRMQYLWPLKYWADMPSAMLMYNLRDHGKSYAWMNRETSDLCK